MTFPDLRSDLSPYPFPTPTPPCTHTHTYFAASWRV